MVHKDPTWEDMLIAYATIPGFVANRNIFRGTWFIESMCEVSFHEIKVMQYKKSLSHFPMFSFQVFMDHACDLDIREMLDDVSERMKYYENEDGCKQSCSYEVML